MSAPNTTRAGISFELPSSLLYRGQKQTSDAADLDEKPVHVLYSFPNKLGGQRICYTAWHLVNALAAAGAKVTVFTGGLLRPVAEGVIVRTTLARGKLRIPYKVIGSNRAMALHDYVMARHIEPMAGEIDIVHTWPRGARRTIQAAQRCGIPTALERCNTHTRFAYEVVENECRRLGVALPSRHESAFNEEVLRREEEEFRLADWLLCPSDFVVQTFLDRGFAPNRLARHMYGFDEKVYYPSAEPRDAGRGLTMLFVGVCAVRKGVHYALEAWLNSTACEKGTFLIAGEFLPAYAEKLDSMLSHPSVRVLGHRKDVPELMRKSDVVVLPSIEEGSALVAAEARGSGCALLVSEAAGAVCTHGEDALVHCVGDVAALTEHINVLDNDRVLLERLRRASLSIAPEITWKAAGVRLLEVYRQIIAEKKQRVGQLPISRGLNSSRRYAISTPPATDAVAPQVNAAPSASQRGSERTAARYVLISPVRDEAQYIVTTLESVIRQTVRPAEWIIVDDGSCDETGRIIDEYAKRYTWIVALHRKDRGRRMAGSGVMEAFYDGYELVRCRDWQFLGKLDGDVGLDSAYFEKCFQRFAEDSKLGICGGVMYCQENGHWKPDRHPISHVRGAIKLYRRDCWTEIGGLIRSAGWDTVDELHANMMGWHTRSFADMKVTHHRPNGAAVGAWSDNVKNGRADYVSGYHPLFMVFKCCKRLFQKPYLFKSFAHAYGYLSGYAKKTPRIGDKKLIRYIRTQQIRRLLFLENSGK
jgi:glycosyltransferase involved in cell wall biosynthesis